jgi:hypothetical protein
LEVTLKTSVAINSKVAVEIYLGRVKYNRNVRIKHLEYERFREKENYVETYIIKLFPRKGEPKETHYDSFVGRAIMGSVVGQEVEVNVGGLSINELRVGSLSGNHFKLKILSID